MFRKFSAGLDDMPLALMIWLAVYPAAGGILHPAVLRSYSSRSCRGRALHRRHARLLGHLWLQTSSFLSL